jgi:hypothetical protein
LEKGLTWKFAKHGGLTAKATGNILEVEGEGPWNSEMLANADKDAESLLHGLYGRPWAVLTIMKGDPIYIPAAAELLIDIIRLEKHKGRIATAIIICDSEQALFPKQHLSQIYIKAGEDYEFFDDKSVATLWLKSKIDSYKPPTDKSR